MMWCGCNEIKVKHSKTQLAVLDKASVQSEPKKVSKPVDRKEKSHMTTKLRLQKSEDCYQSVTL